MTIHNNRLQIWSKNISLVIFLDLILQTKIFQIYVLGLIEEERQRGKVLEAVCKATMYNCYEVVPRLQQQHLVRGCCSGLRVMTANCDVVTPWWQVCGKLIILWFFLNHRVVNNTSITLHYKCRTNHILPFTVLRP